MLAKFHVAVAAIVLAFGVSECCFAQPGGPWGGGDRGGWGGDRGGWGGFRGGDSGGYGGFRGGFPGGGFPGGGFPGGGFPGGGFGDPREMIRRADTNNNNVIEPDEMQNGFGRFVRGMAERAGLNTNQALRVDQVIAAVDQSRGGSSPSSSSSSGATTSAAATTNPQAFGAQSQVALVPGFDQGPGTTPVTAQSQLPLEKRFDERVLERAKDRVRELDRNGNGTLEGEELANYRGDPPIMMSDLNKDGVISLEEMAMRYQARYGGSSSYGGPGGPGGPPGYGGYPGGGYPGGGYPGSSSYGGSLGYRSPLSGPTPTTITTTPSSTSSSPASSSSGGDRFREFAENMIRRNDRNNSGKLEKDEWRELRDPESTDANRDGVITVDEMAARMQSRMGDRGPGGGPGGPGGWGGDRGGGDRGSDRGGGDRLSDRGGDRGSDRGRFIGGGPGGPGFGGDQRGARDAGNYGNNSYAGNNTAGSGSGTSGSSSSSDAAAPKRSYRVTTPAELLPKGLDSWFTRSDTDGDGQVSMAEYAAKWDADVAKKFQQLDANGDSFISADEALRSGPSSARR